MKNTFLRNFLFPSFKPKFLISVLLTTLTAYLFFSFICIPFRIKGISMEPTYSNGGVNFCWRLRYLFSEPKRFDVVVVRFAGTKIFLLKRIIALEGEEVKFSEGKLFINDQKIDEPYLRYPCHWNLSPRRVDKGCLYLIGDNRSMPIEDHYFGQTLKSRIIGSPLW